MSETIEQFEQRQREMPDEQLIELCNKELSAMCKSGASSFHMTVPPRVTDTDMLFSELIRRYMEKAIKTEDK